MATTPPTGMGRAAACSCGASAHIVPLGARRGRVGGHEADHQEGRTKDVEMWQLFVTRRGAATHIRRHKATLEVGGALG